MVKDNRKVEEESLMEELFGDDLLSDDEWRMHEQDVVYEHIFMIFVRSTFYVW